MAADPWLLLIHQLPPKPAYLRVKVWRRLQALGAVALKNSVYVLPCTDEAREDFEWVLREIHKERGEASLCEARLVEGLTDDEVRGLFLRAREEDYRTLASEIRTFVHDTLSSRPRSLSEEARAATDTAVARFRKRLGEIAKIDFFGAPGREAAEGLIGGLEQRLSPEPPARAATSSRGLSIADAQKRTWVTRKGVHITGSRVPGSSAGSSTSSRPSSSFPPGATRRRRGRSASTCSTPSSPTTGSCARSR